MSAPATIAIAQRDESPVTSRLCGLTKSCRMPVATVTSGDPHHVPHLRGSRAARAGPRAGIGMAASAGSWTRIV